MGPAYSHSVTLQVKVKSKELGGQLPCAYIAHKVHQKYRTPAGGTILPTSTLKQATKTPEIGHTNFYICVFVRSKENLVPCGLVTPHLQMIILCSFDGVSIWCGSPGELPKVSTQIPQKLLKGDSLRESLVSMWVHLFPSVDYSMSCLHFATSKLILEVSEPTSRDLLKVQLQKRRLARLLSLSWTRGSFT